MKKLYTTILIIAVALFISCDEKKAEDDIKKAFTKITDKAVDVVDAVDKVTPKPQGSGTLTNTEDEEAEGETESETIDTPLPVLINPALSSERAHWNTKIIFPKMPKHTYTLKEEKTGVTLSEGISNTMQVTATQSAQNVIIVTTFNGKTSESNPIEFTRIPGNTLSFADEDIEVSDPKGARVYQAATKSGTVAGDDRAIVYSIIPIGSGGTIDSVSGAVTLDTNAKNIFHTTFTITAELQEDEKYERATATYDLGIR